MCLDEILRGFSFCKKWYFSLSKHIYMDFFLDFLSLKMDFCGKLQPDWTKHKGTRISTWIETENCLMTSYLSYGNDISKSFVTFERFGPRVRSCQV